MKIIGLMPARNEGWCIGYTARNLLTWCDELIVLEHVSHHPALDWLRVGRISESEPEWNEADFRQRLLVKGRELGGTHFAIVDADEILTANLVPKIRDMAGELAPAECLWLPWLCLWRSLDQYRCDDSPFGRARVPVVFRDDPSIEHKRGADGYQLHSRPPFGAKVIDRLTAQDGGILHLQHANWTRLVAKQEWYIRQEQRRWGKVLANYAGTMNEDGLKLAPVPDGFWPTGRELIDLAAEPWQAKAE